MHKCFACQAAGDLEKQMSPEELERLEMMHKYVLSNAHFYCETVDITRPFPSSSPVGTPSWEFVWNRWLSAAFRAIGLPTHCPHLLQVQCLLDIMTASFPRALKFAVLGSQLDCLCSGDLVILIALTSRKHYTEVSADIIELLHLPSFVAGQALCLLLPSPTGT